VGAALWHTETSCLIAPAGPHRPARSATLRALGFGGAPVAVSVMIVALRTV
jgi:hypothetical protein